MSYDEQRENNQKKWRDREFKRLFLELFPKLLLGTVVSVAAVTVTTSQAFRKPEIDINYLYIEEETLHYELYIDGLDSNIDVESLIIRLESNSDVQEIEGVLGIQSGTFSIVQNRQYELTICGDIGWGEQIFFEKKIKAEALPYIKMDDFIQNGEELLVNFELFNLSQIEDQKITVQILDRLQTIYLEEFDVVKNYNLIIPNIEINKTYDLRIMVNTPKKMTIYEGQIKTNNLPSVHLYCHASGGEIFYELLVEDHFDMVWSDIKVELLSKSKVIQTNTHTQDESEFMSGHFIFEEIRQGNYEVVVKAKVGLKDFVLARQTIFVPPSLILHYVVGEEVISGSIEMDEYLSDVYKLYVILDNITYHETNKELIGKDLQFELSYDNTADYYLSLVLIKNNNKEEISIYPSQFISSQTQFIEPYASLNYSLGESITGTIAIDNYQMSEYLIYVRLDDLTDNTYSQYLVSSNLNFILSYDKTHNYHIYLIYTRNGEEYQLTTPEYIEGEISPVTGELIINSANIKYNPNRFQYEVLLDMSSTFDSDDFDTYRFEISDGSTILNTYNFNYSDNLTLDINEPNEEVVITVYGVKDQVSTFLFTKMVDNEVVYATLDVVPGTYLIYCANVVGIPISFDDSIYIKVTDAKGVTNLIESPFDSVLDGEIGADNYGRAVVEVIYNDTTIAQAESMIYPIAEITYEAVDSAFMADCSFGSVEVIESIRMEVYSNNQLVSYAISNHVTTDNALDNMVYEIRVILISDEEYLIHTEEYTYIKPIPPETITIINGEYFNPSDVSQDYTLKINFEHTFQDTDTILLFKVESTTGEIGIYEVIINDEYLIIEVSQIYNNITVTISDLNNNLISVNENITLVDPPPELKIKKANILYNADHQIYEIILEMNSTYPTGYFNGYSFKILDQESHILDEFGYEYSDTVFLPLTSLNPNLKVAVYGTTEQESILLAERVLNNDLIYAELVLVAGSNMISYETILNGSNIDQTLPLEIRVVDNKNEVVTKSLSYDKLFGDTSWLNYGDAYVELLYNEVAIGGAQVYVYPSVIFEDLAENWSFSLYPSFAYDEVSEPVKVEVYLNNQLVTSTYEPYLKVLNPVDNTTYQIKVILEGIIDYLIYEENYTYLYPNIQDAINITNGEYIELGTGSVEYMLKINYVNTFTDPSATLMFEVTSELEIIGNYEVPVTEGYLEIEVPALYSNITVTVKDSSNNTICISENIPLIMP